MREITVRQECSNRGDCRYGLQGVKVKVPGYQGEFFVRSSHWEDAEEDLMLVLNSAPEETGVDSFRCMDLEEILAIPEPPRLVTTRLSDIKIRPIPEDLPLVTEPEELPPPEGDVCCPADRCFLRSFWPVVSDYRPSVWNEFNSQKQAKKAGVPILPAD